MRKTKTVTATKGRLTGYGNNKTEAKADLAKQIETWCSVPDPHMEVRFGCIIIAYCLPTFDNVAYRVIDPAIDGLGRHGSVLHSSCVMNGPLSRAIEDARFSVAQNRWDKDSDEGDDKFHAAASGLTGDKANDLRRWMHWQRSYNGLIAAGKTPAEAHQMASWG